MKSLTTKRLILSGMLCASLMLSGCVYERHEVNIELNSDYSGIVAALNDGVKTLADKLALIEAAIQAGQTNDEEALKLIQQAVASLTGTVHTC